MNITGKYESMLELYLNGDDLVVSAHNYDTQDHAMCVVKVGDLLKAVGELISQREQNLRISCNDLSMSE